MEGVTRSQTTNGDVNVPLPQLTPIERLKLARGILDRTVDEVGAGYLLIMFVPGSDVVMRSFKGLDTPEECLAATAEVAGMMQAQTDKLKAAKPEALHNAQS